MGQVMSENLDSLYRARFDSADLEQKARDYLDEVEELGGAVRGIETGYFQREIHQAAYRYQKEVESGARTVVGVNRFDEENEGGEVPETLRLDPGLEAEQVKRLAQLREGRDNARTGEALAAVGSVAAGDENLMPAVMNAIDAEATLGEISDVLRQEWGTYVSPGGL